MLAIQNRRYLLQAKRILHNVHNPAIWTVLTQVIRYIIITESKHGEKLRMVNGSMKKILTGFMIVALMIALSVFAVGATNETRATTKQVWSNLTIAANGQTATGYCPHCCSNTDQTVTWNLYTRTSGHNNITTGGHYFLNKTTSADGALRLSKAGIDFVLHLNGYT